MANQQLTPEQMKVFNKALEERITEANEDKTKTKWKSVLPDLMAAGRIRSRSPWRPD